MRALPLLSDPSNAPRSRMFWIALGALALAQLIALWMLCSQQVQKAQARDTDTSVQQLALADCLQYVPGATVASCSERLQVARASAQPPEGAVAGATTVNFTYR